MSAPHPNSKVLCECCDAQVSPATRRRHQHGKAPMLVKVNAVAHSAPYVKSRLQESVSKAIAAATASATAIGKRLAPKAGQACAQQQLPPDMSTVTGQLPTMVPTELEDSALQPGLTSTAAADDRDVEIYMHRDDSDTALPPRTYITAHAAHSRPADSHSDAIMTAAASSLQEKLWTGRSRAATVEDALDESDNEEDESEGAAQDQQDNINDLGSWAFGEEGEEEYVAISAFDRLRESYLRQAYSRKQPLTEEDLLYLRPFAFKVETHMPGRAFAKLPFAFPHSTVPTWKVCQERVAQLSGFEPEMYDCCSNSCCCYVGVHADATHCPYCRISRLDTNGKPRQQFMYLPIIPRLQQFLGNQDMAQKMQYRASEHIHNPDVVKDVFDADIYQSLLGRNVVIDGKTMDHTFFQDSRDVALGLSTDGFAPFRRRKKTCWPLILFNYNLPPEIRFHLSNILSLGVIPGPKKPVDFDSFLWPCIQELLRLELGVHTYDVRSDEFFALRAYLILVFGDIPAISMVMRMKGHNGFAPCRLCEIHGIRIPHSRQPTNYVPLDRSRHPDILASTSPDTIRSYDAANLPLRDKSTFIAQAHAVQFASTETESERLAKESGIKGIPALACLSSLTFPQSFPYDFMHLMWENVMKNVMLLWSGEYKSLDAGKEDYELPTAIWDAIGEASERCGSTIPSCFGPRMPNIAKDKTSWTADSRSFWALFVGPVVLEGRFLSRKFYDHYVELVQLINTCLQFEVTRVEIDALRTGFIQWVQKYEQYYYQYDPTRLSACPVTIHALLHIADSIIAAGPVWASWAFPMERYCGSLQPAFGSRRHPFASLNRFVLDDARLKHIMVMYPDAKTRLKLSPDNLRGYSRAICVNQGGDYQTFTLLPSRRACILQRGVTDKLIAMLCLRYTATRHAITCIMPKSYEEWARLRIEPEGDIINAAAFNRDDMTVSIPLDSRNATFVRYEQLVDKNARFRNRPVILEKTTFYGQLLRIIVVDMPPVAIVQAKACRIVLGIIRSCVIETSHTRLDIHYYTKEGALEVVDITTVQCLVGRVEDRKRWATIDRSGSLARAIYVENE